MEPHGNQLPPLRPSYMAGTEESVRTDPVRVEDLRTNLFEEFSLACSNFAPSQRNSAEGREPLEVYIRVKPFSALEIEQNESQDCISIQDDSSILLKAPRNSVDRLSEKSYTQLAQKFTFSRVFGPETTQAEFFEGTVRQPVKEFLQGQNRLIFTYGITNAGKTYTFQGTPNDAGILPRSMNMLFDSIQGRLYSRMDLKPQRCRDYIRLTDDQVKTEIEAKNAILRQMKEADHSKIASETTDNSLEGSLQNSNVLSGIEEHVKETDQFGFGAENSVKFSIWISFCEIYNECIYDLLDPISSDKLNKRKTLRLAQDIKGCSFIKDLQWIQVSNSKEAHKLLNLGKKYQSIACTKLNSVSSRSHSIFSIRLLRIEDTDGPRVTRISELSLCDLAGSERCTKTQNEGHRLKESGNINTSLLILGKCINALKNSQQSKLQQHVPFRESKLTHYLQSFFCGKGKICTIVNISQSASAYDETLNVLKFSAVAQKILILDTSSKLPQAAPLGQKKSARDVSFIINNADNKMWVSRKRVTVQWDSLLEDVMEDEGHDDSMDETFEVQEQQNCLEERTVSEEEEKNEETEVVLKMEQYQRLLDLIEDLKNKLKNEKKEKLFMELKIREEVAKEFTQHFVQQENNFSEYLERERELFEDRCDERVQIFKNLVTECTKEGDTVEEEVDSESFSTQLSTKVPLMKEAGDLPLENFIDSMQSDLTVIKKQAMEAQLHISSISDSQEANADFDKKLAQTTDELAKIKEELAKKTHELEEHMNKMSIKTVQLEEATMKIAVQNTRIEDLISIVHEKENAITKLQDLVSYWEKKMEDYDKTVNNIKGEVLRLNGKVLNDNIQLDESKENNETLGRKRLSVQHVLEEQPPTKKGPTSTTYSTPAADHDKHEKVHQHFLGKTAIMMLQDEPESQLTVVTKELEKEKAEKQELNAQVTKWQLALSISEKKALEFGEEVEQIKSSYGKLISELQIQKEIIKDKDEKVKKLLEEVEDSKQHISEKVSQVKAMQFKIDELGKLADDSKTVDLGAINLKDFLDSQKDHKEKIQLIHSQTCADLEITNATRAAQECAFHHAIEGLWKECQRLVKASSHKNHQIRELEKQLIDLRKEVDENDNNKLKLAEITVTTKLLKEKENLAAHLEECLLESTRLLEAEKQCVFEANAKESELTKQASDYQVQLGKLEENLKEKESAVLDLEKNLASIQEKYQHSEKIIIELNKQEIKLEDLQNKLESVQCLLEEKGREEEIKKEETEQLKKELEDSSAQVQTLTMELQKKDEIYTDLKEKLADAKKQIQQVEKEVSTMREERKLLTNKVNEYEKSKEQMSRELDIKQRIIQQLKKELANEKLEEVSKLYRDTYEDLQAKEKIIEDMRLTLMEQEQTQIEQDQALEAKVEENEKLVAELKGLKQRNKELKNIRINGQESEKTSAGQEASNTETVSTEVTMLQNKLKECEEKYSTDRKKWLEEKMILITQAKEAEQQRNKEMRKYVEDRERHTKLQTEVEAASAQLLAKDRDLQKWREERDQLVAALEVQLKTLLSSNKEKDEEIEKLRVSLAEGTEKEKQTELRIQMMERNEVIKELKQFSDEESFKAVQAVGPSVTETEDYALMQQPVEVETVSNDAAEQSLQLNSKHSKETEAASQCSSSNVSSGNESEGHSETVLDSSEMSNESQKVSRFPKPELEIHFTPLQPNKIAVKHQGSALPVMVKISRTAKKRKSSEIEEVMVKRENRKNATLSSTISTPPLQYNAATGNKEEKDATRLPLQKGSSLKNQISSSSTRSLRKKDGTLQKLGDLLHSSPTILHTKAKKLIETISSPKPVEVSNAEFLPKAKRGRRKLYTTDISSPLDIPIHSIMNRNEKESDHLIIKRRLRTKTAR
nr:kinesin-like protein KIF20B isoform X2 [Geotrypetes seraphini]XP_033799406.1 kinesin-like protein KIF20B isoform X2 [Geotrypetes seraphini]XP_033799407.1 kinesin-like protein KIF20B isoform X2 [Geotrypetes seraphini]XP_033799408.1 kinesin-like protein KIF20B isoform X2 [Geotrypetes seraphini]